MHSSITTFHCVQNLVKMGFSRSAVAYNQLLDSGYTKEAQKSLHRAAGQVTFDDICSIQFGMLTTAIYHNTYLKVSLRECAENTENGRKPQKSHAHASQPFEKQLKFWLICLQFTRHFSFPLKLQHKISFAFRRHCSIVMRTHVCHGRSSFWLQDCFPV